MRLILDENLPAHVKSGVKRFHRDREIIDINEEHKGILDFEIVEIMKKKDVLVTGDKELHKNILKVGGKSVYYDVQLDNLVEIQVKVSYYLKGYPTKKVETTSEENIGTSRGPNELLRKRFDKLKEENARLKVRLNVLEGKLESIHITASSVLDEEENISTSSYHI